MSGARVEALLERTMGLKAASIGPSAIRRAVALRLHACNLEDEDGYWALLQRSSEELQELIEAVVVPETWFFRDPEAFAALARLAFERSRAAAARPLRLLSLPCSTGEEPYTMAMALLDAGLRADGFRIDAVDISLRSLAAARRGTYGRNSFRSPDLRFRDRYFEEVERGYRIADAVRAPVHFVRGNVLDADFLLAADPYDFVFCRNLLIYFDGPTQDRAIGVLKRLLAPQGVLFAGHSETALMPANGMVSAKIPMAFAFRAAPKPAAAPPTPAATAKRKPPISRSVAPRPLVAALAKPRPVPDIPHADVAELRRIADSGRLEEAARGCDAHLRAHGPAAGVLLLLALISDALGNTQDAVNHYRKVLYLEPDNAEALGHLSLLLRRQGDHTSARLLDDRARRHAERRAR